MTTIQNPATEKQVAFAKALLEQRVVPQSLLAQAEEALLSKATASQFIGLLTALPRKVGSGRPASTTTTVVAPAPMRELAVGFYTVAHEGGHTTFRISKASWANGKLTLGILVGSNNERSYKDVAFITPNGFKFFSAHAGNQKLIATAQFLLTGSVDEARAEFMNQAEANAMASNTCLCCLKTLTVPASVSRGLGPICAKRYGYGL
jgi:hypothetical protein